PCRADRWFRDMVRFLSVQEIGPDPGEADRAAFRSVPSCGGSHCCGWTTGLTLPVALSLHRDPAANKGPSQLQIADCRLRIEEEEQRHRFHCLATHNPQAAIQSSGTARILPCLSLFVVS